MEKVSNQNELFARIVANNERIIRFGVVRLGVFGSFVSGNVSHDSDVDFFVEFAEGTKTYRNFMDLAFFLEELTGRKVELLTNESLSPYIGPKIKQEVKYVIAA